MEQKNSSEAFKYTYSAKEQEELKKIREKYISRSPSEEESKMERLRRLDASVTKKATVISLILGVMGAIVMGSGMSLIMTDLGAHLGMGTALSLIIGVAAGAVGLLTAALAYPVYHKVSERERERLAPEIIALTDELMK